MASSSSFLPSFTSLTALYPRSALEGTDQSPDTPLTCGSVRVRPLLSSTEAFKDKQEDVFVSCRCAFCTLCKRIQTLHAAHLGSDVFFSLTHLWTWMLSKPTAPVFFIWSVERSCTQSGLLALLGFCLVFLFSQQVGSSEVETLEGLCFFFFLLIVARVALLTVVQIFNMTCTWMSAMLNKAWYTSTLCCCSL